MLARHVERAARADRADRRARDRRRPRRGAAQPAAAVRRRSSSSGDAADHRVVGRRDGADRARRAVPRRPAARPRRSPRSSTPGSALARDLVVLPDPRAAAPPRRRGPGRRARAAATRRPPASRSITARGSGSTAAARVARRAATSGSHPSGAVERELARDDVDARDRRARGRRRTRRRRSTRSSPAAAFPIVEGCVDHVRVARRRRGGAPQALGVRPAVVAAARAARRHRPLAPHARAAGRLARRVQARGRARRPRRVDRGSAQPATARAIRSAPTRSRTAPATRCPSGSSRDPEARAGHDRRDLVRQRRRSAGAASALYLPARFRRTRRYPLLVVHDGHDYLRYAALGTILDNLIHRLEIPELDRRAHQLAQPARRVRQRRAPRAVPHRRAGAATSSARSRSRPGRRAAA